LPGDEPFGVRNGTVFMDEVVELARTTTNRISAVLFRSGHNI
jgi:hypothetical protein